MSNAVSGISNDSSANERSQKIQYRIVISDETLNFKVFVMSDPIPLGRQILEIAGIHDVEEFALFGLLGNGDFEDIRLDEPFDLRAKGIEKFLFFRTDRTFRFTIDNRQLEWGKPLITGLILRRLANIQSGYALYLEVRGGQDKEVLDGDIIDLTKPGIERFITVIQQTTEGLIGLPSGDREYLGSHEIEFEVVNGDGQVGVVLKGFKLPQDKFDSPVADVLILLPSGYPDASPDMFFVLPWLRLRSTTAYPTAADVAQNYNGSSWQRWSRHSSEWRPGIDGLHTMIARVRHAFEVAK